MKKTITLSENYQDLEELKKAIDVALKTELTELHINTVRDQLFGSNSEVITYNLFYFYNVKED
jgi:hypothetical protein